MYTGRHIGIAFLDTGIFPHIDFDNRLLAFYDFIHHMHDAYDDNGHGTHVAGIAAGSGAASYGKYQGVAPQANIIALKVLDENGNGNKEHVIEALQWIRDNRENYNIRIVNISVGTTQKEHGKYEELLRMVELLWDEGLVIVAAAGNMGPGAGTITIPGNSRKVITVGSSDMLMNNHRLSGRGPTRQCVCKPDIVAPGNGIISCGTDRNERLYVKKSGTSMSTPFVSGAIAVLLEQYPSMTNFEVKCHLRDTALDMGLSHNMQGWGKFQLQLFLKK